MIVVKVELHSAITGKITSLGQMVIDNVGGTTKNGNYRCRTFKKGAPILVSKPVREARVLEYPRLRLSPWCLVKRALENMKF